MGTQVNYSGLVVAGIGFFLTRFTVTLAIYEDPIRFYFAGIIPLVLGLGLAAFGIALAVADFEASLVRTTAIWCVIGAGTMLTLVLLTLLGSTTGGLPNLATVQSQAYLSNFLIGGSVGGTLTGLYAAANRRHRNNAQQQATRLQVLNRLLRHEILNAVTVIHAYNSNEGAEDTRATEIIEEQSEGIERTIEEVRHLARSTESGSRSHSVIDLRSCIESSVRTVNERNPDAVISIDSCPRDVPVRATSRLELVFTHLLENAVIHAGDTAPEIEVAPSATSARISVIDEGQGLSERQQLLLETGEIQKYDDPETGFDLHLVRLYIENFGGSIEVEADQDGSTITVVLPLAEVGGAEQRPLPSGVDSMRPAIPHLLVTLGAALLAGVFYGIVSEWLGGSIAGIGIFYGTVSPVVGWITHEFHSVVFGFVFAGLVSVAPSRYRNNVPAHVAIGIAWAVVLWAVAAGVIAPIWLRLLGISASIPNLSFTLLVSHLAWGTSLGLLTAWGYTHVTPVLTQPISWIQQRYITG